MCNLYLYYYEGENIFMDDCGEVVYDLFTIITPQDLFLFHNILDDYETFPMVGHPDITVHITSIPTGEICTLYKLPKIDAKTAYTNFEFYERTRMANVTG